MLSEQYRLYVPGRSGRGFARFLAACAHRSKLAELGYYRVRNTHGTRHRRSAMSTPPAAQDDQHERILDGGSCEDIHLQHEHQLAALDQSTETVGLDAIEGCIKQPAEGEAACSQSFDKCSSDESYEDGTCWTSSDATSESSTEDEEDSGRITREEVMTHEDGTNAVAHTAVVIKDLPATLSAAAHDSEFGGNAGALPSDGLCLGIDHAEVARPDDSCVVDGASALSRVIASPTRRAAAPSPAVCNPSHKMDLNFVRSVFNFCLPRSEATRALRTLDASELAASLHALRAVKDRLLDMPRVIAAAARQSDKAVEHLHHFRQRMQRDCRLAARDTHAATVLCKLRREGLERASPSRAASGFLTSAQQREGRRKRGIGVNQTSGPQTRRQRREVHDLKDSARALLAMRDGMPSGGQAMQVKAIPGPAAADFGNDARLPSLVGACTDVPCQVPVRQSAQHIIFNSDSEDEGSEPDGHSLPADMDVSIAAALCRIPAPAGVPLSSRQTIVRDPAAAPAAQQLDLATPRPCLTPGARPMVSRQRPVRAAATAARERLRATRLYEAAVLASGQASPPPSWLAGRPREPRAPDNPSQDVGCVCTSTIPPSGKYREAGGKPECHFKQADDVSPSKVQCLSPTDPRHQAAATSSPEVSLDTSHEAAALGQSVPAFGNRGRQCACVVPAHGSAPVPAATLPCKPTGAGSTAEAAAGQLSPGEAAARGVIASSTHLAQVPCRAFKLKLPVMGASRGVMATEGWIEVDSDDDMGLVHHQVHDQDAAAEAHIVCNTSTARPVSASPAQHAGGTHSVVAVINAHSAAASGPDAAKQHPPAPRPSGTLPAQGINAFAHGRRRGRQDRYRHGVGAAAPASAEVTGPARQIPRRAGATCTLTALTSAADQGAVVKMNNDDATISASLGMTARRMRQRTDREPSIGMRAVHGIPDSDARKPGPQAGASQLRKSVPEGGESYTAAVSTVSDGDLATTKGTVKAGQPPSAVIETGPVNDPLKCPIHVAQQLRLQPGEAGVHGVASRSIVMSLATAMGSHAAQGPEHAQAGIVPTRIAVQSANAFKADELSGRLQEARMSAMHEGGPARTAGFHSFTQGPRSRGTLPPMPAPGVLPPVT